jgi:hypothetical protein
MSSVAGLRAYVRLLVARSKYRALTAGLGQLLDFVQLTGKAPRLMRRNFTTRSGPQAADRQDISSQNAHPHGATQ